jgi:hypothetical protein
MRVKSFRVQLVPQGTAKKVKVGLPFSLTPNGPVVGTVEEYDEKTGIGLIRLEESLPYGDLEALGINFGSYVDCD